MPRRQRPIDPGVAAEYADARTAGEALPAVRAFRLPDRSYLLTRGFHRAEALLDAINDNIMHGLKRTNEDKRRAVERCLGLQPDWTQEKVAEWAGVSVNFVSDIVTERAAKQVAAKAKAAADTQAADFSSNENPPVSETSTEPTAPGKGRPKNKDEKAERVAAALAAGHAKSGADIAAACKFKLALVARIRKRLVKEGDIPTPAPPLGVHGRLVIGVSGRVRPYATPRARCENVYSQRSLPNPPSS